MKRLFALLFALLFFAASLVSCTKVNRRTPKQNTVGGTESSVTAGVSAEPPPALTTAAETRPPSQTGAAETSSDDADDPYSKNY